MLQCFRLVFLPPSLSKTFPKIGIYDNDDEQGGIARLEKRKKWEHKDKLAVLNDLDKFQEEARKFRTGIWQYGDIESDDEDTGPAKKPAGGRR